MPKVPQYSQEPLALYPVVAELDAVHGRVTNELESLQLPSAQSRITLMKLASRYGEQFGPNDSVTTTQDTLLQVGPENFFNSQPETLRSGLYIHPRDPRFRDPSTEQLVKVRSAGTARGIGVVFPAHEFHIVARSASDLAKHVMAKTRRSNENNPDAMCVEARVGRSAGHALVGKVLGLNELENDFITVRNTVLIPLYREAKRNGDKHWSAHYGPKNLDKKRQVFDELTHEIIDTATINLDLGSTAIKAAHRAETSRLYRARSTRQRSANWLSSISFVGKYLNARHHKVIASRDQCQKELKFYHEFLDSELNVAVPA
ncbi:MAG: hypothetical protein ACR2FM_02520 [Candidatus Saccharimonadales bacterium]